MGPQIKDGAKQTKSGASVSSDRSALLFTFVVGAVIEKAHHSGQRAQDKAARTSF
jgi:hypothetical protein